MTVSVYRSDEVPADLPTPDVYFGRGYGAADEAATGSTWLLVTAYDGSWQMPILRTQRERVADAQSPYGYAGIYAAPTVSERDAETAWVFARSLLLEMGVIALFLRRSPLVRQAPLPPGSKWVVQDHPTRSVVISSADDMWMDMEGRCRTSIRKAERLRLTARIRPAATSDFSRDSPFRRLYEDAMRRRGAAERYFFKEDYYSALREGLGADLLVGEAVDEDGTALAAALFMRQGAFLHYHLSGAVAEAGSVGATNLLIWEGCKAGHAMGATLLHLGGGIEGRDSLYKFKRSFGGVDQSFSAVGVVLEQAGYDAEVTRRAKELGCSTADLMGRHGFPAYRWGT